MLYLREGSPEGMFEVWSRSQSHDMSVARGLTELEVRRMFRDRAIAAAAKAVNELLADVKPRRV